MDQSWPRAGIITVNCSGGSRVCVDVDVWLVVVVVVARFVAGSC